MNRYVGNSGIVERIPEPPRPRVEPQGTNLTQGLPDLGNISAEKKPLGQSALGDGLGGLLSKFGLGKAATGDGLGGLLSKLGLGKSTPELEDFLLIAFLYLLYRETKDVEFLLIGGALLLM